MISQTLSANKKDPKKAIDEIKKQIETKIDFSPDLAFFYSTQKYEGKFQYMLNQITKVIGEKPLIGGTVDGVIHPHELRTDGCFLVLCKDEEASFEVISTNKRGKEGFNKLSEKISKKEEIETILVHYPLVFLANRRELLSVIARGKYYDLRIDEKNINKLAKKFSDYLTNKGVFYPSNRLLDKLSKKTDKPIVGINLLHTNFKSGTPLVFADSRICRGGLAALLIKGKAPNIIYEDIYPEKPNNELDIEEFIEENFKALKKLKIQRRGNIISSINNKKPMKEIKNIKKTFRLNEEDMVDNIEKGKLPSEVPYVIFLRNKDTNGVSTIGVSDIYPFSMFPTYLDLSNYSKNAYLGFEPLKKFESFCSSLKKLNNPEKSFTFSIFDISTLESFDLSRINYTETLKKNAKQNYFSIITGTPSIFLPKEYWEKDYLPEAEKEILFSGTGINISLEI